MAGYLPLPKCHPFSELNLQAFDTNYSSSNYDLSFLQIDPEKWNTLAIITSGKQLELIINDSSAFQTNYQITPGKLKGVRFLFNGLGEVDYVRFYDPVNELIYHNEFD
ncbi:MAG: hypothetical protein PVF73_07710 [Bacteroidales bacterium]